MHVSRTALNVTIRVGDSYVLNDLGKSEARTVEQPLELSQHSWRLVSHPSNPSHFSVQQSTHESAAATPQAWCIGEQVGNAHPPRFHIRPLPVDNLDNARLIEFEARTVKGGALWVTTQREHSGALAVQWSTEATTLTLGPVDDDVAQIVQCPVSDHDYAECVTSVCSTTISHFQQPAPTSLSPAQARLLLKPLSDVIDAISRYKQSVSRSALKTCATPACTTRNPHSHAPLPESSCGCTDAWHCDDCRTQAGCPRQPHIRQRSGQRHHTRPNKRKRKRPNQRKRKRAATPVVAASRAKRRAVVNHRASPSSSRGQHNENDPAGDRRDVADSVPSLTRSTPASVVAAVQADQSQLPPTGDDADDGDDSSDHEPEPRAQKQRNPRHEPSRQVVPNGAHSTLADAVLEDLGANGDGGHPHSSERGGDSDTDHASNNSDANSDVNHASNVHGLMDCDSDSHSDDPSGVDGDGGSDTDDSDTDVEIAVSANQRVDGDSDANSDAAPVGDASSNDRVTDHGGDPGVNDASNCHVPDCESRVDNGNDSFEDANQDVSPPVTAGVPLTMHAVVAVHSNSQVTQQQTSNPVGDGEEARSTTVPVDSSPPVPSSNDMDMTLKAKLKQELLRRKQIKKKLKAEQKRAQLQKLLTNVPDRPVDTLVMEKLQQDANSKDEEILYATIQQSGVASLRLVSITGQAYNSWQAVHEKRRQAQHLLRVRDPHSSEVVDRETVDNWETYLKNRNICYSAMRSKFRWFQLCTAYPLLDQLDCSWTDAKGLLTLLEEMDERKDPMLVRWKGTRPSQ